MADPLGVFAGLSLTVALIWVALVITGRPWRRR